MAKKIEVIKYKRGTDIFIKGILHLRLRGKILSIQSWVKGFKYPEYFIEYHMEHDKVITKYVKIEDWKEILKQHK